MYNQKTPDGDCVPEYLMNHSPTEGAQGSANSKTPKNAKTLRLFAIVLAEHIQSAFTDIPALYETEQEARNDMMAPLESSTYPMVLLPADKYETLERQLAQSEERVKALAEGLDKLTAWGMYCPDWADRNSKDEYAKDFMATLALLSSSKTN